MINFSIISNWLVASRWNKFLNRRSLIVFPRICVRFRNLSGCWFGAVFKFLNIGCRSAGKTRNIGPVLYGVAVFRLICACQVWFFAEIENLVWFSAIYRWSDGKNLGYGDKFKKIHPKLCISSRIGYENKLKINNLEKNSRYIVQIFLIQQTEQASDYR